MTKKDDTAVQGCFVALLLFVPMTAFNAFVICKLWAWIVVPITGLHAVGMIQALALACVLGFMTSNVDTLHYEEKDRPLMTKVLMNVAARLLCGLISLGAAAIWARVI